MSVPKYLTKYEVCERLSCSLQTVNRLLLNGALTKITLNKRAIRISELELQSYLAKGGSK